MEKVGIVVLNYKNYKDTMICVNSILEQKNIDLCIVIVDNGSNNESAKVLSEHYKQNVHVKFMQCLDNLGYAKGNNIGIQYLQEHKYDYIFIANSDLVFTSENILYNLLMEYEKGIGVLIPIIKNLNGSIEQRVAYKRKLFLLRVIKCVLMAQIHFVLRKFCYVKRNKTNTRSAEIIEKNKNVVGLQRDCYVISGSGFMLTPDFFSVYNKLFPETFLYFEEWATLIYIHKAKLLCKVVNTDIILHKGAASTIEDVGKKRFIKASRIAKSGRKVFKLVFMSKNMIVDKYN